MLYKIVKKMVYNNVVVLKLANYYSFSPFDKECEPTRGPHTQVPPPLLGGSFPLR